MGWGDISEEQQEVEEDQLAMYRAQLNRSVCQPRIRYTYLNLSLADRTLRCIPELRAALDAPLPVSNGSGGDSLPLSMPAALKSTVGNHLAHLTSLLVNLVLQTLAEFRLGIHGLFIRIVVAVEAHEFVYPACAPIWFPPQSRSRRIDRGIPAQSSSSLLNGQQVVK
ncbi:hypothetical protein ON010_g18583 [Phytophthora cinnamomi]|nr:hypothetical protein ON010_g18583 [Phytophthora cinnamomi]